ncbi:RNA recognition motif-containing protein, putative [Eimeria acervulina]|uniref:RNA recognition motif-containing protein, putative n=1 Tax=Eimeria acervulina TaxID=5801 RepID=U6GVJ9_EIMAC|nr:RNA recognition motif-containing protein, putative [Eimeria acervulina]CDI84286.1 RNA recognition motif-containing protein, putative [Eimeria acervulina]
MATPFPAGVPSGGTPLDPAALAAQAQLLSPANLAAAARCMYTRIDSFTGEFKFLSLDYPSLIFFQGRFFPSARHALLAAKHPTAVEELACIEDMKELKQIAKTKQEDPDWPRYRLKWMELIQRDKFRRNADLREKLKQTGGRDIVWINTGDAYFGQTRLNKGQNHLGRILMEIRQNIIDDTELESWLVICHDIETEERSLPVLRLLERREGDSTTTEILLRGKSFYRIGKLADNDLVALNPSVSRRHAALVVLKGGHVLLIDLKSKAKTFKNGMPLDHDHVGVQMQTNDSFSLGASSRHYLLEIDTTSVVDYLQRRGRELNRELSLLAEQVNEAQGITTKSLTKVFVGGLAYSTSRYDLCELFAEVGNIKSIVIPQVDRSIPPDYEGAYSVRGIAFVQFEDAESAKKALQCNGKIVNGRSVVVTPANLTREERAAQEDLMAEGEMNFVAATDKTFDHPTHGSLRTGHGLEDSGAAAAAATSRNLLQQADPLTGEPLERSARGNWLHDDERAQESKCVAY